MCGRHLWLANIHLDSAVLLLSSWLHLPRLTLSVPMPKRRSADAGGTTWVPPSRRPPPTSHRLCAPSGSGASGTTPSDSVWQARRGKSAPPRSLPSAAASRRIARATARRLNLAQSREPKSGFVRRRRVGAVTRARYERHVSVVRRECELRTTDFDCAPPEVLDMCVDAVLTAEYFDGGTAQDAREIFYGVLWARSLAKHLLPHSWDTCKGFKKACPASSREPTTLEHVVLLCDVLLEQRTRLASLAAAAALLHFDTYARPSELLSLRCDCLYPPPTDTNAFEKRWAVTFYPSVQADRSKVGDQDDTVLLGQPKAGRDWISVLARQIYTVARRRQPADHVFGLTLAQYEAQLKLGSKLAKFTKPITPHLLRHGGASHDCVCGYREDAVGKRGRWRSQASVARYSKLGRYWRVRATLSKADLSRAQVLLPRLAQRVGSAYVEFSR